MTYDLKATEKKWQESWEKDGVYAFAFDPSKPTYTVDTPPPYVSADHLHAGHVMSYTQAEFIVRFKRMRGFNVLYPMGFDDNGLPTERFVETKHGIDKSTIARSAFIDLCLQETAQGAQTYKRLWNALGISVDWSKTYSTISPLAQRVSQWSIIDLHRKGALYRSESPILWCTACQTALAQADLEDRELDSRMNYVSFGKQGAQELVIATTRPELLPACVALYVNPNDARYMSLIDSTATVPLFGYEVPIKASEAVNPELGTGLMMVCTWGDQEDLAKWKEDRLDTRVLLMPDGTLSELGGDFAGMTVPAARGAILKALDAAGALQRQEALSHAVNVHERCGTPTEFIRSKQWFIRIADQRDTWLAYARKLNWFPADRAEDYRRWVDSLKWDWCVSRQRYYGVPLPVWYCASCETPRFATEDELPVNPAEYVLKDTCAQCGGGEFVPETDVMDTWATSSCTPFLIRELVADEAARKAVFPASLRPNAFEIIRTWDFYSIVKSHYHFGDIPFENVMISGHGLDEHGKKFSKRLGNYVPADQLLERYGADPIRYWATGALLGQNLRFSASEIEKGRKTCIKLWNVARLIAMATEGYVPATRLPTYEPADAWIRKELNDAIAQATTHFEAYAYAKARDVIDGFFWSKFADNYLEFVKYRVNGDESSKEAAQETLLACFREILKLYAPIMPHIAEELFQARYGDEGKSIHLSRWAEAVPAEGDQEGFSEALAAIEEIRRYKSSRNMGLGRDLDEYRLKTKVDLARHGRFIEGVMRIASLHQALDEKA